MTGTRSTNIGGNAVGNVITTGDKNKVNAKINASLKKVSLPPPDTINLSRELAQIRLILEGIAGENNQKLKRALDDAEEEAKKTEPNKDEVGNALERALKYAEKGINFAGAIDKLVPHLTSAVAWLGSNWHSLLSIVGLVA